MSTQSEQINELAAALTKFQAVLKGAKKDSKGHNYTYANLETVIDAIRAPLAQHGLAYTQTMDGTAVVTTLMHTSGQWIRGSLNMPIVDPHPQKVGAIITYARRYSLSAMVGLEQTDDDCAEIPPTDPRANRPGDPAVNGISQPGALNVRHSRGDEPPMPSGPPPGMNMAEEFPEPQTPFEELEPEYAAATQKLGDYVIKAGKKYKNMTLSQVGKRDGLSYMQYFLDTAARDNKPLSGDVLEFVNNAKRYFK